MFRVTFISLIILLSVGCSSDNSKNLKDKTLDPNEKAEVVLADSTVLEWFQVNKDIESLIENYKYITLKDSSNKDSIYNEIEVKRTEILKKSSFGTMDSFLLVRKSLTNSVEYDSLFLVNGMRIIK